VAVGLSRAEIMAGVNRHRLAYYGVAAFVSLLALVFMATIVRRQIKLQRARDELWAAANIDALTGLPNRNRLHDIVAAMMDGARSEHSRFAVFLIDVDNFKMVNDTLGHEAGDLVLRTAARRLRRMSRKAHVVARLGGDEFAILLPGVGGQRELEDLAQRVMSAVRRKMKYRGHSIEMSISIGIACFPDHANAWTGIFRAADLALYRAKQAGRNRSVFFEPPMLAEVETRFAVVESARSAIRSDRVVPFYQPEIDIETGEVVGFEALARIRQDDDRISVPAEFASALEDPEVGPAFGLKMLERVIADLKCWSEAGLGVRRVAVNASNVELRSGNYAERIVALLAANGVDPHCLEIEVTETAAFDDSLGVINHNLNTLAAHGVSIALDDFGTGFASLTHLKSLPVTKVKIDRSFVCNIVADIGSASIIDAIVRLSHGLGKSVVAEGVEDEEQLARLRALDCDVAQGFLFSRPVPFDGVAAFLLRRSAQMPAATGTPADRTSGRRANQRLRLVQASETGG
jgi:diguanylate cyclase (GGDEF)-like protein